MNTMLAERVISTYEELDAWIVGLIDKVDTMLRGHCQHGDCFRLSDISEVRTSLAFCADHYYERMGARNLQVIRGAGLLESLWQ